jgi:transglutaminase-like putative cysteine protease
MKYRVDHVTRVRYRSRVRMARFNLRLEPELWPGQVVENFKLTIEPRPSMSEKRAGPYPFNLTRIEIDQPIDKLEINASFRATAQDDATLDLVSPDLSIADLARAALDRNDLGPWAPAHYLYPSPLLPGLTEIAEWASQVLAANAPSFASALALTQAIHRDFTYDSDATDADTPVAEAFEIRRGVCQDFAHVLIEALRSAGLPAAYVSGYLRTTPPPGKPRLVGVDAMHAWAALWCGAQRGWVGLDPTNGSIAGSGHIAIAIGRDYSDVAPIDGIFVGGGSQRLSTSVDVVTLED